MPDENGENASQAAAAPVQAHGRQFVPSNFPISQAMVCKDDLTTNWEFFGQQYEDYEVATELSKQPMSIKLASLRSIMGRDCLQIFRNLSLSPEQQESVQSCLDELETYFKPQRNVVYERYVFNSCVQSQDESVVPFINRLRKLASSCNFGTLTDELIRDRLVISIKDKDLKGRLLRQKDLSLQKAIELSKSSEVTNQQLKSLEKEERKTVEEIDEFKKKDRPRNLKKPVSHKFKKKTHDPKKMSPTALPQRESANSVATAFTVKDKSAQRLAKNVSSVTKATTSLQSVTQDRRIQ